MNLVEDHECPPVYRARPVQGRMRGHLRVGHRHPGVIGRGPALRVPVGRVQRDAEAVRRARPLVLEVLGRREGRRFRVVVTSRRIGRLRGRRDQGDALPGAAFNELADQRFQRERHRLGRGTAQANFGKA